MSRILVVEDDAETRKLMHDLLTRAGHAVRTAPEGRDALRQLAEAPADVILTDIFMPGMDGLEIIRQIRHNHPGIRILAITGQPQRGSPLGFAAVLGADRILTKPIRHSQLLSAVNETLESHGPAKNY